MPGKGLYSVVYKFQYDRQVMWFRNNAPRQRRVDGWVGCATSGNFWVVLWSEVRGSLLTISKMLVYAWRYVLMEESV